MKTLQMKCVLVIHSIWLLTVDKYERINKQNQISFLPHPFQTQS
jgi:hypothetical protein